MTSGIEGIARSSHQLHAQGGWYQNLGIDAQTAGTAVEAGLCPHAYQGP